MSENNLPCFKTKRCRSCNIEKNLLLEYSMQRDAKDGYNGHCKKCVSEKNKMSQSRRRGQNVGYKWRNFALGYYKKDVRDACLDI